MGIRGLGGWSDWTRVPQSESAPKDSEEVSRLRQSRLIMRVVGMRETWLVAVVFIAGVASVPIDNGVEGEPEVECGPTSITINFNTRNNFEGHVYVKGLFADEECRSSDGGRQVAGIELPFDSCNVRRTRSLNPRGVFVGTTLIITFHPQFVTKVDRAYKIQCFYMEADKTVDTNLRVSDLTTELSSQVVQMPVCRYELLDGPTGSVVEFALVGQPVFHKWTCDSETEDTFCMIVHSCFVDDTSGDQVELIDSNGCAVDLYLLNNIEYPMDLMGGVEAHVFKYADRADLYFQCQITLLVKEPGQTCPRPMCSTPAGRGAGDANPQLGPILNPPQHPFPLIDGSPYLPGGPGVIPQAPRETQPSLRRNGFRGKREVAMMDGAVGTLDVLTDLNALELADNTSWEEGLRRSRAGTWEVREGPAAGQELCLSGGGLGIVAGLSALGLLSAAALTFFLLCKRM